jgi:hypothetical protein
VEPGRGPAAVARRRHAPDVAVGLVLRRDVLAGVVELPHRRHHRMVGNACVAACRPSQRPRADDPMVTTLELARTQHSVFLKAF